MASATRAANEIGDQLERVEQQRDRLLEAVANLRDGPFDDRLDLRIALYDVAAAIEEERKETE